MLQGDIYNIATESMIIEQKKHILYQLSKDCPSSDRSETKMVSGTILRNTLQLDQSAQGGVWAIGVVFVQKVHEFTKCSDDSVFGQVGIKFLPETPIISLDFAVVCWFCGEQNKQKKL